MCEQKTIDVAYFTKELDALKASLTKRTPEELGRYLMRLAAIVIPSEKAQATEIAELKEELAFQIHRNELNETELYEKIQLLKKANSDKDAHNDYEKYFQMILNELPHSAGKRISMRTYHDSNTVTFEWETRFSLDVGTDVDEKLIEAASLILRGIKTEKRFVKI